jgi:hypothetical protein
MRIASADIKSTVLGIRRESPNKHWRAIETDGTPNITVVYRTGHQEGAKSVKLKDIDNLHDVSIFCIGAIQVLIAKYKHRNR